MPRWRGPAKVEGGRGIRRGSMNTFWGLTLTESADDLPDNCRNLLDLKDPS